MRLKKIGIYILFLILTIWIISDLKRSRRIHDELDNHGITLSGVIVEIKVLENTASILCKYKFNSEIYQTWVSEINCMKKENVGDTVYLDISTLNPNTARFSLQNCN